VGVSSDSAATCIRKRQEGRASHGVMRCWLHLHRKPWETGPLQCYAHVPGIGEGSERGERGGREWGSRPAYANERLGRGQTVGFEAMSMKHVFAAGSGK
jgi:hypothetical protein